MKSKDEREEDTEKERDRESEREKERDKRHSHLLLFSIACANAKAFAREHAFCVHLAGQFAAATHVAQPAYGGRACVRAHLNASNAYDARTYAMRQADGAPKMYAWWWCCCWCLLCRSATVTLCMWLGAKACMHQCFFCTLNTHTHTLNRICCFTLYHHDLKSISVARCRCIQHTPHTCVYFGMFGVVYSKKKCCCSAPIAIDT